MIAGSDTDRLLDLIYDAALDNDLWRTVLAELADATRSQGGVLFGQSMRANTVYFDFNGRMSEECNRVYQQRHMQNPWNAYMQNQPVGRVVFSDEAVSIDELRKTAFYDEVLRPQDAPHNVMIALASVNGFQAAFNICRSSRQGPFGADERKFFTWLVPHLRRSIALGFRIDAYQAVYRAAFEMLEHQPDGVVIVDRQGRTIYANAAACAFEAQGALALRPVLALDGHPLARRFGALLRGAVEGSGGGAISIPMPEADASLTLLLAPLRGQAAVRLSAQHLPDAAAIVFIVDPLNRRRLPMLRLRDAYGLTRAEARVAFAVSAGTSVVATADALGVSANTVKTLSLIHI